MNTCAKTITLLGEFNFLKTGSPSVEMTSTGATKKSKLGRIIFILVLLILVVGSCIVVYNNYSLRQTSRKEFDARLDRAIDTATDWLVKNRDYEGNPPLMYMVGDMARLSSDPRLKTIVDGYLASNKVRVPGQPVTWYYARLVDPNAPVPELSPAEAMTINWQYRWNAFAVAPTRVHIPEEDRADFFSATKYSWGTRLHIQLLALDIYRAFNGPSTEVDQAINPVAEGVAKDAYRDFRVNDAYFQRTAFLLGAGRPDLVRSRWVDRILDNQKDNGSWGYCWYGWCRGMLEFKLNDYYPVHPTVQAAWALYQLKYRYPQWIEEHYR
jgi:hypothetical protein